MMVADIDPGISSEFVKDKDGAIIAAYWTLTCAWCGHSEKIDVKWYPPVSDRRNGISTLGGWEVGHRLIVCPSCVEHDEWSRLWPTP